MVFKRDLLSLALASALLGWYADAYAQTADAADDKAALDAQVLAKEAADKEEADKKTRQNLTRWWSPASVAVLNRPLPPR